jgi:cbb3-type cytochrome oxidase subunit 3
MAELWFWFARDLVELAGTAVVALLFYGLLQFLIWKDKKRTNRSALNG